MIGVAVPYIQIEVGFYEHEKFLALLDDFDDAEAWAAVGVWTALCTWARARVDPDNLAAAGFIPRAMVRRLAGELGDRAAQRLAVVGLLDPVEGGWMIHDYAERQHLDAYAAQVANGRRGAAKRYGKATQPAGPTLFDDLQPGGSGGVATSHPNGLPTGHPSNQYLTEPKVPTEPTRPTNKIKPSSSALARFDEFWSTYPRRTGKEAARRAWAKALTLADPDVIIAAAARYRDKPGREPTYTKHPTTWLNQGCWDDEPDEVRPHADADGGEAPWEY